MPRGDRPDDDGDARAGVGRASRPRRLGGIARRFGRRDAWPADGPRPGDPRSTGPRPRASIRDGAWVALTGALVVVTVLQLVRLVWTLLTSDQVRVTGGGALLGFLVTVVWLLTIYWLAAGAWRRSVWGCPFEHTADAPYDRRCQRHAVVATDGARGDVDDEVTEPAP